MLSIICGSAVTATDQNSFSATFLMTMGVAFSSAVRIYSCVFHLLQIRSTGAPTAILYSQAKVHKKGIPSCPVLSTPGSGSENSQKIPRITLRKVPDANRTPTLNARGKVEFTKMGFDGSIVFLNVKSLYTTVSVNEAIEIALRSLYSSDHATEMSRSTLKSLLRPVVTAACFNAVTVAFVRWMS